MSCDFAIARQKLADIAENDHYPENWRAVWRNWHQAVHNPAKFIIEGLNVYDEVVSDFGHDLARHELIRLPAPVCFFQFEMNVTIIKNDYDSDHVGKTISQRTYIFTVEDPHDPLTIDMLRCNSEGASIPHTLRLRDPSVMSLIDESRDRELYSDDDKVAVAFLDELCGLIAILAMKTTEQFDVTPNSRVNARRIARGDEPLPSYRVIRLSFEDIERERSERGLRSSPRPHFRRGHIRRLSDGRLTPVAPAYVMGDVSVPMPTYRK